MESGQKVTSVEDNFLSVFAASREMVSAAQCAVVRREVRAELVRSDLITENNRVFIFATTASSTCCPFYKLPVQLQFFTKLTL